MTDIAALAPLMLALPMAGFLLTALVGRRLGKQAHWVPVLAIFAVWVIAMVFAFQVLSGAAPVIGGEGEEAIHGYEMLLFTWIPAGDFVVDVGIVIDPLTACLLIVVTTMSRHAVSGSMTNPTSTTKSPAGIQVNRLTA